MDLATITFDGASIGSMYYASDGADAERSPGPPPAVTAAARSLHAFLLEQATALLDWTLQAELEEFLARRAGSKDALGRAAVVRNGYQPVRTLRTNLGAVTIRIPKVRSRVARSAAFHSRLARPYLRSTRAAMPQAPAQFLHGLGSGDLHAAIAALMGPEAAALPGAVMQRLARRWKIERGKWLAGSLAHLSCAELWVESVRRDTGHRGAAESILLAVGRDVAGRERMLAVSRAAQETANTWRALLGELRRRGLQPPLRLRPGPGVSRAIHEAAWMAYPETPVVVASAPS